MLHVSRLIWRSIRSLRGFAFAAVRGEAVLVHKGRHLTPRWIGWRRSVRGSGI
jgi:hypothetical protein